MNATSSLAIHSQSLRVRLFFDQTSDEQFLVLAEVLSSKSPELASQLSIHTFQHEDLFLERLVAADLSDDETTLLAGTVIRSVQTTRTRNWVELNLTEEQIAALGLDAGRLVPSERTQRPGNNDGPATALHFADTSSQFYPFLIDSTTPFVLLSGSEHRFTFINQPCLDLIGIREEDILMKTFLEALPELAGQPFQGWLDQVYDTGVKISRKAQVAHIRRRDGGEPEDRYFDFIYYPVRDSNGRIYGVMAQAADVTERVISEAAVEGREEELFRQWAELDSIYRTAPVGMALLDGETLRLLRLNEKQAEMMGAPIAELLGKKALDLTSIPVALMGLFKKIEAGEAVRNAIVEKELVAGMTGHRTWLVNISPFAGASGEVLAYTSIALEIPDEP